MRYWIGLLMALAMATTAFAQSAIINEFSQGPTGGTAEWVEILTIQDNLNMQNWTLRDGGGSAVITFSGTQWQSVGAGTIIVVYNGSGTAYRDAIIPPDSVNFAGRYVIAGHTNTTLFTHNNSGVSGQLGWINLANSTLTDNPILMDASAVVVHDWDQNNAATFTVASPAGKRPGSNTSVHYNGNLATGVSDTANWSTSTAATATPAAGNSTANIAWIASLRGQGTPPSIASVVASPTSPVPNQPVTVNATINSISAGATITFNYRFGDTGDYTSVAMTNTSGSNYTATIPGQANGTLVDYYITAVNPGTSTARYPTAGSVYLRFYDTIYADGALVVNEINYNGGGSRTDWFELVNNSASTIDLSYWHLRDNQSASNYVINAGTTLAAGAYMVFCQSPTQFALDYPSYTGPLYGTGFGFGLDNTGDMIRLYDVNWNLVDSVNFTAVAPWPVIAAGYAIELGSLNLDDNNGANYHVSAALYGTPGATNSSGDATPPSLSTVTANTRFLVTARFSESILSTPANLAANFSINGGILIDSARLQSNALDVYLYLSPSTPLVSGQLYTLLALNQTDLSNNTAPSLSSSFTWTAPPLPAVIITEIMYNPGIPNDPDGEWVEIYNTTSSPINLNGWIFTDSQSADTIRTDLILGAASYAVLAYNPDSLANTYGITTQHGYSHSILLSNSGERVAIWNASGTLVDSVRYASASPWPASTNGKSIALIDLSADNDLGASWALSSIATTHGEYCTPGLPITGVSAPTLVSPISNFIEPTLTPTFVWTSVAGAKYQLQVASDSLFTNLLLNQSGLTDTSHTITSNLTYGSNYYWRVRAVKNDVPSSWTGFYSFNVSVHLYVADPAPGVTWLIGSTHTISWLGNAINVIGFYSTDNGVNWIQIFGPIASTGSYSWTVPSTASTACIVKITGDIGGEALSQAFTIAQPAPPPVPADVAIVRSSNDMVVSWTASTGAISYNVYYTNSQTGTWQLLTTTVGTTYTDSNILVSVPSRLYRVTANN